MSIVLLGKDMDNLTHTYLKGKITIKKINAMHVLKSWEGKKNLMI